MTLRSLRFSELMTAALLSITGVAVLIVTARMRVGFAAFQPRLFPSLIGWLLIAAGAALTLFAMRPQAAALVDWPSAPNARRVAIILTSIAMYLAAIDVIGMELATIAIVWFQIRMLGGYRPHVPIAIALLSGIVVHVVFTRALGLMLPAGIFGR